LTEVSPEIRQSVFRFRQLLKFKPREAVEAAILETEGQSPLIAGWALSRLIAWAFYDQHESKRIPKDERKKRAAKRPFRPRYAYKAGQLYLLHHLYQYLSKHEPAWRFKNLTPDDAGVALSMYLETGQLKKNFGHSGLSLATLHNDVERRQELLIVYHVMDFLVRADLSGRDDIRKVEVARYFVKTHLDLKDQVTKKRISESYIDKFLVR